MSQYSAVFKTVSVLLLIFIGLAPVYAERNINWAGCGITKKAFMKELATAYQKKNGIKINIAGGGATVGIRGVARGKLDIGGSCRYTLDEPIERNVLMKPVAWDALVAIVNPNNAFDNITIDQIRGIYTGRIRDWSKLGRKNGGAIDVYVRKGKISGVGSTIRTLVFDKKDLDFFFTEQFKSSGPLERQIEKNPNAIGITGISSARKRNVKILKLEGKEPTFENIQSGEYLLYRPLYLVLSVNESRKEVMHFIKFIHSGQGRAILRRNGTVPYLDALHLVLKQVDQHRIARDYMSSN